MRTKNKIYRYNTLNEVIAQSTPDGGLSKFYYDRLGRLAVSQNAKQAVQDNYSYTLHDELGRIREVGQLNNAIAITQSISQNGDDVSIIGSLANWLNNKPAEQITRTFYDRSYIDGQGTLCPQYLCQTNLRNRVSYTAIYNTGTVGVLNEHTAATYYSYDIHGNVYELLQDYGNSTGTANAMNTTGNRFKKIEYKYDLISGKVNEVAYQRGQPDQFYHRYEYDAENRLILVETSSDKIVWQRDARYNYYKHGPLARTVLGEQQVQGIDYAYTLQGWLKGINATSVGDGSYDMGEDGKTGSSNSNIARDVYGISLNYFGGDYQPIGAGVTPFSGIGSLTGTGNDLFNGNIKAQVVNIPKLGEAKIYGYRYDQLNRLTKMDAYEGLNNVTNAFTPVSMNDYKERFSYNADGSILTLQRNGQGSNVIDNATWNYYSGTHRLEHIDDPAGRHGFDAGVQGANNYTYSPIGEMTSDVERGLTGISWTVYGKLEEQQLSDGRRINYTYDAGGNRISKQVSGTGGYTEWYVRDARGDILSIYKKTDILRQTEQYKYGSGMLGIRRHTVNMEEAPVGDGLTLFIAGETQYNLNDQRDNNMATVSDRRTQHDDNSDGIVDYYTANIITAQDYSSFGSLLEGRQYGNTPRRTYNGKELDKETGWQDYGMRPYLVDVPVFGKVDPLTKEYAELTPYQFASNTPIQAVDLDGLEAYGVYNKATGLLALTPDLSKVNPKLTYKYVSAFEYAKISDADKAKVNYGILVKNVFTGGHSDGSQIVHGDPTRPKEKPISTGTYNILENKGNTNPDHNSFFVLDPQDKSPYDKVDDRPGEINSDGNKRSGYNFHPGRVSWGCVTVCKDDPNMTPEQREEEWNIINKVINNTKTEEVPDNRGMQKYIPFTKQTKFGTLEVIDKAPTPLPPSTTTPQTQTGN